MNAGEKWAGILFESCVVLDGSCQAVLEEHLRTGRLKMMRMLEEMRLKKIPLPAHLEDHVFENLNTPEDVRLFMRGGRT